MSYLRLNNYNFHYQARPYNPWSCTYQRNPALWRTR